ncbi:MAG: DinB family protein [Chloroflexota bacterium]
MNTLITQIEQLPAQLDALVGGLSVEALKTAVSPTDWTIAQVVHHLADSHSWGLHRCKKVLTQEAPIISSYDQDSFAQLPDGPNHDIQPSLQIINGIHARWAVLLESLSAADWERPEVHEEYGPWQLRDLVGNYARHGQNHLQQIEQILTAHNK